MESLRHEKVQKFEEFVDRRLKPDLAHAVAERYSTDYGMFHFCIADSEHDWREGVRMSSTRSVATNDPIAPSRAIPREDIKDNPNCLLIVTPKGGHLGWVAGSQAPRGAPWTDPVVMDFLEHLEKGSITTAKIFDSCDSEVARNSSEGMQLRYLEIMDANMGSGIVCRYHSIDEAIESGAAPILISLDLDSIVDVQCTIDIMDHLLACEYSLDQCQFIGGIKFGEIEHDCFIAHGVSANLHEVIKFANEVGCFCLSLVYSTLHSLVEFFILPVFCITAHDFDSLIQELNENAFYFPCELFFLLLAPICVMTCIQEDYGSDSDCEMETFCAEVCRIGTHLFGVCINGAQGAGYTNYNWTVG
ncbi:NatC N(alpha)-terminal acetyltransferase, Mak10 subunit [Corchorus olitorius]|uniref:NatC N(Alpha)-terminal acetyltransferase, Mak10 subunit n=1 Tax=Corchorus olitorius TaxID=93759 RepID=A0A1R3ITK1_9ROSI|nr:NatC N(alpha)-terminal acetyltransferase, Mak10 subunit [Corchorus olitorius]